MGLEIVKHFEDVATGKDANRPGLRALLETLATGAYDYVVVDRFDRLARGHALLTELFSIIAGFGCQVISAAPDEARLNPVTVAGQSAVDELQEFFRQLRAKEGQRKARESGAHIGRPPAGFYVVQESDGSLWLEDVKGTLVRQMFRQRARGIPPDAIASRCPEWAVENSGRALTKERVQEILDNNLYAHRSPQGDRGCHEPLVDLATWRMSQTDPAASTKKHRHALQGRLYAPGGDRMYLRAVKRGERAYEYLETRDGATRLPRATIDQALREVLSRTTIDRSLLRKTMGYLWTSDFPQPTKLESAACRQLERLVAAPDSVLDLDEDIQQRFQQVMFPHGLQWEEDHLAVLTEPTEPHKQGPSTRLEATSPASAQDFPASNGDAAATTPLAA